MSAFFIATVKIKDQEKFQEYASSTGPTLTPFGGELLKRGKAVSTLAGSSDHQMVGIIAFPDIDALDNWYQSDAYQALIPLRDSAADMTLTTYVEPQ
jgi:uncharacterized protein (DUF1330 family)